MSTIVPHSNRLPPPRGTVSFPNEAPDAFPAHGIVSLEISLMKKRIFRHPLLIFPIPLLSTHRHLPRRILMTGNPLSHRDVMSMVREGCKVEMMGGMSVCRGEE